MGILDEEREYLFDNALIQVEKEYKEWCEWCEYQKSLQKPAKIELIYDKDRIERREAIPISEERVFP